MGNDVGVLAHVRVLPHQEIGSAKVRTPNEAGIPIDRLGIDSLCNDGGAFGTNSGSNNHDGRTAA